MKKIIIGIVLFSIVLVFSQKDVKMTPIYVGNVYCPFYNDTILGAKSDTSVWYYINVANLAGYMTITYSVKSVSEDIICRIYKVFTNDTTMNANYTILVDSIDGTGYGTGFSVDTTIQSQPIATAFMRFIVQNIAVGVHLPEKRGFQPPPPPPPLPPPLPPLQPEQSKLVIKMKINLR